MSKRIRCAIYTRKSTEEGLDQEFNSLDAQREACEAFIQSQRGLGWIAQKKRYDDGGISGGTMDRPALQTLLTDIEKGKVDLVVVYKVDRLTRSLMDFAKIIETFDARGISFVSVTQQFNTANSMGRLTLNVLLSFAQFEREVTAERIRDKIAASKKKGMWMGGPSPLGYNVVDRKLVITKAEATTARKLFNLYIELGTVRKLKEEADRLGITTKHRVQKNGKKTGGKPFSRGNLYQFLSNPLYIGKVPHKGETYPGQHKAIIDQATWDTVQRILAGNAVDRSCPTNTRAGFLLTGLVFDETGEPLCQSQADKKGKRYRYYVSKRLMHDAHKSLDGWRLPARSLEATVITPIQDLLQDQVRLMDLLHLEHHSPSVLKLLKTQSDTITIQLTEGEPGAQRELLQAIIQRAALSSKSIIIALDRKGLAEILKVGDIVTIQGQDGTATITVPITLQRRGVETKLMITGSGKKQRQPDPRLCHLIAQARFWFEQLASGEAASVRAIAQRENIYETEVSRVLRLAFLAPRIIEAILDGRQAEDLTVKGLKRLGSLPHNWEAQQDLLRISG